MVVAYVLIDTYPGREEEIADKLKSIGGVSELYALLGEYDFIAKVNADSYREVENIVMKRIRSIQGILDTKTLTEITS